MPAKRALLIFLVVLAITFSLGKLPVGQVVLAETFLETILTPNYTWHDDGGAEGVRYGHSLGIGDFNGDGFADAVVGAPNFKIDGTAYGAIFVYNGSANGLSEEPSLQISPLVAGANFGISVSNAGDVNGDLIDDLVVGADYYKQDGVVGKFGAALVYYGSEDGLSEEADWIVTGPHKDSLFGHVVSGVGDVDHDGYDDVLVGAHFFENTDEHQGAAFLYRGSDSGLISTPFWQFEGELSEAQFGFSLARLGDLNKDGYADFAVGAPQFSPELSLLKAGRVYVFYGSATGPQASPDWSMLGSQADEEFGSALAGAGDVDGNGYLDLIIGARGYDEVQADIDVELGAVYLFTNSAAGLASEASWMVQGYQAYSGFGAAIAGLGDVNRDGFDDIAVGAYLYTDDQPQEGAVFVYRGGSGGLPTSPCWTAYGNKADTEFGYSLAGGGDLNGDERMDLLVGAPIFKYDDKTPMGRAFSYHGMATGDIIYHYSYLPLLLGP